MGHHATRLRRVSTSADDAGFTLVEMAVVMSIMGIVLAGAVSLAGGQRDRQFERSTMDLLDNAEEALELYYIQMGVLPCPADGQLDDDDPDYGRQQVSGSACDTTAVPATRRILPWRTLNLPEPASVDAWNMRLTYHVDPALVDGAGGLGGLQVRDNDPGLSDPDILTEEAAYVLISHGANTLGAWTRIGNVRRSTGGASANERENADGAEPFVDRAHTAASGEEFDDFVRWATRDQLRQATGAAFTAAVCAAAVNVQGACSGDSCTVADAVLARCP